MLTGKDTKKIIILGTGGNCTDILDTLLDINDAQGKVVYECVGFLDDNSDKWGKSFFGVKVLGPLQDAAKFAECFFVFGIGSPLNYKKRREILATANLDDNRLETIIHPTASVSRMARVGPGTIVLQNVTITSNAFIGKCVYVLPNSVISHDTMIGDFTCITGGVCISGNVQIGQSCYLGTNASIREGVKIGDFSMIGMGSVVVRDVPANSKVVGNPAKPFNFL
jgi:sugar O-acyltransferase (sialic acid O-acetyltransferase NeuD family)